jgi:hypothetical protein
MSSSIRRRSPTGIDSRPALANRTDTAIDHAARLIHSVCCLAGSATLIADFRQHLVANRIDQAIAAHDTAALFDWLLIGFGYQGISNQIAFNYMQRHGPATWRQLTVGLETKGTCPKLRSYWQFAGCGYRKGIFTCSEPSRIETCCLPKLPLRNGRLSQNACSLYLFIRDVMEGDLVGWVDRHLAQADQPRGCRSN